MRITATPPHEPAFLQPQAPAPPILPKPGKDNLKLQRLLKRAAKKKATLSAQQTTSFRASLSPVNEASPDLEHSERSSPLKPPQTTTHLLTINLPPRFSIKPVIHPVSSPFPKGKPFTFSVTEQRSLSEHLKVTAFPAVSPVQGPSTAEPAWPLRGQPQSYTQLPPSSAMHSVLVTPEPPGYATPAVEPLVVVSHIAETHASVHSRQLPSHLIQQSPKYPGSEERHPPLQVQEQEGHLPPGQIQGAHVASQPRPVTPKFETPSPPEPPTGKTVTILHVPRQQVVITSPAPQSSRPVTPGSDRSPDPRNETQRHAILSATQKHIIPEVAVLALRTASTDALEPEARREQSLSPAVTSPDIVPKHKPALPPRNKLSGWSRLKKHLIVETEDLPFPDPQPKRETERVKTLDAPHVDPSQEKRIIKSRAVKMWDAILYQMTTMKTKKHHGDEKEMKREGAFPFRRRLPLLLHRPRFDARKLKELASKPMTKITTLFEVRRIQCKTPEEVPLY